MSYALLLQCCATLALVILAQGTQADSKATPSYYLLGVDVAGAGAEAMRLQRAIKPSSKGRWALTDYVRRAANEGNFASVKLQSAIDQWNPKQDPYNFAAISVRGIDITTTSWPTGDSRTYVSINLLWMYVGHDMGTRSAQQKIPELRFAIAHFAIREFITAAPPSENQLDAYVKTLFDEALVSLFQKVENRNPQQIKRKLANTIHASVPAPAVLPSFKRALRENFGVKEEAKLTHYLQIATAAFIEDQLLVKLRADRRFDDVILLPNVETLKIVEAEWPSFASRVAALSPYSANLAAIGFGTPKLLQIGNLCDQFEDARPSRYTQIPGLEIRSNLAGLKMDLAKIKSGVSSVSLSSWLAADVKVPLKQGASIQVTAKPLKPIIEKTHDSRFKPKQIAMESWLGAEWLLALIAVNTERLVAPLAQRLLDSIETTPHLSHPSIIRKCQ